MRAVTEKGGEGAGGSGGGRFMGTLPLTGSRFRRCVAETDIQDDFKSCVLIA